MLQRKVAPPFKPKVKDDLDTTYFDEEFLSQPVTDSYEAPKTMLGESVQKEFEGFTYTGKTLAQVEGIQLKH